jgi:hypothetical protein
MCQSAKSVSKQELLLPPWLQTGVLGALDRNLRQ